MHQPFALALCLSLTLAAACADQPDEPGDPGAEPDAGTEPDPDPDDGPLALPDVPHRYAAVDLPPHFETPAVRGRDNTPSDNPITDDGATLGRVLFYDTALSANGTIACASCHLQSESFADPATLSSGFDGGLTGRNAMSLVNARWYRNGRFFWDERAATLEEQVLMPIQDPVEMGLTLEELVAAVESQPYYDELFTAAFGDDEVTSDRIARALAQFVRSMVSYQSRYDVGLAAAGQPNQPFANFTAEENQGKDLFFGRAACATCHLDNPPPAPGQPPGNLAIFYVNVAANNGLDATTTDQGLGAVTGNPADDGKFKSPSLRNVARTGPYMHDGRFETLREVVEHYNDGVQAHPNLDPRLRGPDGEPRRLGLTGAEIDALVAFLGTLSDDAFVTEGKFDDPFVLAP